eukprot:CAMPEP_0170503734 /NCGR_PEP_ID=MMETSP0208-20121228/45744_1 /TAXON_ID=197538 /ORGANISM="Strombidium inclinatum, Strain S3" /LENGTH=45 /DNA_ID= /DNA_START= /DNA_END= /DNA_ORIENTATION=
MAKSLLDGETVSIPEFTFFSIDFEKGFHSNFDGIVGMSRPSSSYE